MSLVEWIWDADKDRLNRIKHGGLSLADGVHALSDPWGLSKPDPHPDGDRWRTIGMVAGVVCLFVVHTDPVLQEDGQDVGRIIGVRRAERRERMAYEQRNFEDD